MDAGDCGRLLEVEERGHTGIEGAQCVLYWGCTRKVEKIEHGAEVMCLWGRIYSPG